VSAAFDAAGLASVAQTLIAYFGRAITLTRNDPAAALADNTKPWLGPVSTPLTQSMKAVFASATDKDTLAKLGTTPEMLAALGAEAVALVSGTGLAWAPDPSTRVVDGSGGWEIVKVGKTQPGPTPIVYTLYLKR